MRSNTDVEFDNENPARIAHLFRDKETDGEEEEEVQVEEERESLWSHFLRVCVRMSIKHAYPRMASYVSRGICHRAVIKGIIQPAVAKCETGAPTVMHHQHRQHHKRHRRMT